MRSRKPLKPVDLFLPRRKDLVFDEHLNRVGEVQDVWGLLVFLRPKGGGTEWTAPLTRLRPARASDSLRPRVAQVNADTRKAPR